MKRSGFKRKATTPLKRTKLRIRGVSDSSVLKERIQAALREVVTLRDGGCLLRDYPETGRCSGPLQAEHLNSRSHMVSFADSRNCICLCRPHHIFWKPKNSKRYWEIVEEVIGPTRWDLVEGWMDDRLSHKVDLKMSLLFLEQEIRGLKGLKKFNEVKKLQVEHLKRLS